MIIRSQDKKELHNLDKIKMIRLIKISNQFHIDVNGQHTIGIYSTEEKAIKVLDMIEKLYVESVWTDERMIIANRVCFEMPSDEEVEVQHEKEN